MTFSYDITLSSNLAKVRFHIGDTNEEGVYLQDETINALVTSEGSVGGAVIACIKYIIMQLSSPNFRLDWLTVSNEQARQGFENMLKQKAQEFGISLSGATASASIALPYRADSFQHSTASARVDDTDSDEDSVYDGS